MTHTPQMDPDRRKLLQSLASLAAVSLAYPVGAAAERGDDAQPPVESFATMSARLSGYAASGSTDAAKMLAAFATPARSASLKRLAALVATTPDAELDAALSGQGLEANANELIAAWYSGVVKNGNKDQIVLYIDAYVWRAMTFTKPMGVCGGAFGYWSSPPK